MPIDPNIALAVKTPEAASPMQTIGGLMQMRDAISQIALRNAQTQGAQQQAADVAQQTEQRARDNQSWNKLQDIMRDPDTYTKVAQGDYSPIYGAGVSANVATSAIKNFDEQRKTAQALKTGDIEIYNKGRALLQGMLEGADSEKDDAISAAQYNSGRENVAAVAPELAKHLPVLQPGQNYRQQLQSLINTNGFHQALLADAATLAGKKAEADKATAEAALITAKTPGAQAESQIQQAEAAAMQGMTPDKLSGMVKGSIDPAKYPDQYQRTLNDANNALRLGLGTKGVQAAIKDGADRVAARENAVATAQVTSIPFREAQLEQQQWQRNQSSYQFHAAELDKLTQPLLQINQRIQRLNESVNQGTPQADAMVAPELLSVMAGGMGSGLRMNESEIARIVGGRSKWEGLKSAVNQWQLDPSKANTITPEQRTEIHALVDAVSQKSIEQQNIVMNARSALAAASGPEQHRAILADVNNRLAASVAPKAGGAPGAAPQFKVGDTVMYNGKPHKVTGFNNGKLVLDGNQ